MHYILQTIAFQLLFLVVYDLFLKKETFFNTNRIYLLVTPILSLLLPFVQISALRESVPQELVVQLPAVVLGANDVEGLAQAFTRSSWFTLQNLWLLGAFISLGLFGYKLFRIFKLKRNGTYAFIQGIKVIKLPETDIAFTFFGNIFLGAKLSEEQQRRILLHEQVHVIQKHSWDLLLFEVLRVLFWFNPLMWVFQKRTTVLHEFIADRMVADQRSQREYYTELLQEVFQTEKISFINTFFNHSLIKKRIVMLQKSRSKKIVQLKYLLLIPVIAGMLFYTSCAQDATAQGPDEATAESRSEIMRNIEILTESIAKKGEMTSEEEDAIKVLYVLTNPNGLETPVFQEVKDKVGIPFGVIETVPVYPGCEGLSKSDAKNCFSKNITEFVMKEFNTKVAKPEVTGKQRIVTQFKIDRSGKIVDVKARAEHLELQEEAIRVLKKLPTMTPGEQKGKKVGVIYSLPIVFAIK